MKESGIFGIGEIPDKWSSKLFKWIFSLGKGLSITKENLVDFGIPVISYGQVHSKTNTGTGINPSLIRFVSEKYLKGNKKSLVHYSDFIFADTSEDLAGIGNCVYVDSNETLFAGYHSIIARPIDKTDSKYFAYLFLSDVWRSQLRSRSNGVKVYSITQKLLGDSEVIIPPPLEQKTITSFLDKKADLIESIMSDLETQIALLKQYKQSLITETVTKGLDKNVKMKNSGVEWIGNIPEHWVCCKQKYLIKLLNGRAYSDFEFEENGKYRVLRVGNLFTNNQWYYSNLELEKNKYCNDGDLLYSWSLSYAPIIWHGEKTIFHYHIWNTELNPLIDKNYAYYYLLCLTGALKAEVHETTMGFITMNIMNNSYITLPTLDEQRSIVTYLDKHCSQIDAIMADKQTQLETLKKHKQSLIYEYATGKRRVAEVA